MFLFTNANYLLPYTGAGSGVRRALEYNPNTAFSNGVEYKEITHAANEFVITIPRESNQVQAESNQVMIANERKSNQANEKITKFKQKVTKL